MFQNGFFSPPTPPLLEAWGNFSDTRYENLARLQEVKLNKVGGTPMTGSRRSFYL